MIICASLTRSSKRRLATGSRLPSVIVKQVAMSGRSKRLFQALCAVLANRQQTVGKIVALLATHSIESLANGRRNGCGHGFSGALRELFRQSMRLRVLDI